jgi:hypothetical protein
MKIKNQESNYSLGFVYYLKFLPIKTKECLHLSLWQVGVEFWQSLDCYFLCLK